MQNINKNMIRKSIVMDIWDFTELVDRLTGIDADYGPDGLSFNGDETKAYEALSEYFGVRVTSVHADDCAPIGVWITYKDTIKKDKMQAFREEISREAVICFAAADYITEHMADGSIPSYNNDLNIAELPEPLNRLHRMYYSYRCLDEIKDTGKILYLNYGYVSVFMGIDTYADGTQLLNDHNRFVLSPTGECPLLEALLEDAVIMTADTDEFAEQLLALTENDIKALNKY